MKLFQEILSPQDKSRILSLLVESQSEITARLSAKTEFTTQTVKWAPPLRLEVEPPPDIKLGLGILTVQFDCHNERYFSKVEVAFDDWKLYFLFHQPLYRLQRRQYQRLKIPSHYRNRVLLMNINEKVWNEECELVDISLSGCSLNLSYRNMDIQVGDILMVDIKLGDHPSFIQIGRVCYRELMKIKNENRIKVGVQFRPHPKYALHLKSAVQNLAIDLFTNWSQKNPS